MRIRRILVPTDFSDCSAHAVDYAVGLARTLPSRITLIHVFEPVSAGDIYGFVEVTSLNEQAERSARRKIANDVARLRKRGIAATGVVSVGAVASAIVRHAAKSVDLIVIGTHGRSGLNRWLLGSVAERVVRLAPCPVLTVRAVETR
jgi:nucleotide-binding universal stress UspA family protein